MELTTLLERMKMDHLLVIRVPGRGVKPVAVEVR
jgi:hypothetical protein